MVVLLQEVVLLEEVMLLKEVVLVMVEAIQLLLICLQEVCQLKCEPLRLRLRFGCLDSKQASATTALRISPIVCDAQLRMR